MFSYCIIPYSARSNSFFDGVYEDGLRVRYNNNAKKAFAFSRVLSPSHDLLTNVNSRLLQGMHEGKNVVLILASSHYINFAKERENVLSSSKHEENNINVCNNISASTSETSTMCIDLCLNLLTHLFDSGHCQNASATVSMTTVFFSGVMVDELRLEQEEVKSISECTVKEVNKNNAATQWAIILQRLQQRHTSSTFTYNKLEHSHHNDNNNYENKESSATTLDASVCVITICLSHSGSLTIIDVDDDALVLEQLATVVTHKVCHVASTSSVQPSFTLTPQHICREETITTQNHKQECTRFITLLESLLSGKMHKRHQEEKQYSIDKFDVVHTVAFANPLISEAGTLRIMEFASQLNTSLLMQKNVITNNNRTEESEKELKECTCSTSYHHSLPLTESPLSSLSPPPFVTQLSQPSNVTVAHDKQCEYNIDNRFENDNEHKCNADKSYNKTRRTTQLLSPSPFLPSSSASFSSSSFLSHYQRNEDESVIAHGKKENEEAHDYVIKNDNYNAYEFSDEGDHYNNKDNVEEISVHLDSDTNADEEEAHHTDESNAKCQNNQTHKYENVDGCHT